MNAKSTARTPEQLAIQKLKDVVERFYALQSRDATNHEFACCIYSAEDLIAKLDSNYRRIF